MVEQRPVTKEWGIDIPVWGGANERDIETAKEMAIMRMLSDLSRLGEVLGVNNLRWEVPQANRVDWWTGDPNELFTALTTTRVRLRLDVTFIPKPPEIKRKFNVW